MYFRFAEFVLDPSRRELLRCGEAVHVEPQVFDLLLHLIRNRDRVVSKDELLSVVWQGRIVSESTLDSRITAARRAIGDSGERQQFVRTIVRKGFRFVGEVQEASTPPHAGPGPSHGAAMLTAVPSRPGDAGDDGGPEPALAEYRDVIEVFSGAHRGRALQGPDGSVVAVFPGVGQALSAAVDFQRELAARNAPLRDEARVQFRVGIESGKIDGAGDAPATASVDAAAALAGAASPGGICVSADVRTRLGDAKHLRLGDLEPVELPDTGGTVTAYRVDGSALSVPAPDNRSHDKPAVAVLPFLNMSGDPEQEYFSDGVTEDILTALSKHRSIQVIARTSTFAFKGHGTDVRRVGRHLGADYIVEGSVRKIAERMRITVQLVATDDGGHIWAERYDRALSDIFDVQDEITSIIAARIEPEVAGVERLRAERKPPQSFRAWDYFHLAMNHFFRWTVADNREAERLFRRAIELDPQLAQGYAWLSYAIVLSMLYFDAEPDEARLAEALDIARQSVELDDRDALVRFMYGRALLARRAYGDALSELEIAVELNSGLAVAHCGLGDSLAYEGRFSEAFDYFQKAIDLSPYDPQRWAFYAYRSLAHVFARDFDRAIEWAQKATRVPNCHYWPFAHRVAALGHAGRRGEIETAVSELLARKPGFSCSLARARLFYVKNAEHLETYVEGLRGAGLPE